ncbi:CHAD domain-containing protein [Edaphobacter albus]|uniref:CHAD domain-containing protein n=1 Tax=Edaphobacter sp. 4G125 TaxID=2763071 RepID=UPI00164896A9|nr:CHAD domain-containing protein [Edaphobacter sp. 4G125]QNI37391.1 CHAD domain-containing protein [Edaphobacter sp. 4G125]
MAINRHLEQMEQRYTPSTLPRSPAPCQVRHPKLMAASSTSAHPIRTLREYITTLGAAITLCLVDPNTKHVHRLRTTTRRIEAQLALLDLLPGIPDHAKLARKTKRSLKKLRRAAGEVRDLDVQMDLIQSIADEKPTQEITKDSESLRSNLKKNRKRSATKLRRLLQKEKLELTLLLKDLLDALKSAEVLSLSSAQLKNLAKNWFHTNLPVVSDGEADAPDHLHDIRKVAKLTRYLAENAPKKARATRQLAQSFEDLQQSGGDWHDWLVLAEIAKKELGSSSPLVTELSNRSHAALAAYKEHLHRMLP